MENNCPLEENDHLFEDIFTTDINLFCVMDRSGYFLRVNQGFEKILERSIEDFKDRIFLDFIHPDDYETTEYAWNHLLEKKQRLYFNNRFKDGKGYYATISWCIYPSDNYLLVSGNTISKNEEVNSGSKPEGSSGQLVKAQLKTPLEDIKKALARLESSGLSQEQLEDVEEIRQTLQSLEICPEDGPEQNLLKKQLEEFPSANISSHNEGEKAHLLIVDDSILNRKFLENLLKDDYRLSFAESGEEALMLAVEADQPDLILLDVVMTKMDGYEVCTRLQKDQKTRDIPVIFLTASGELENEEHGLLVGAIDYIRKPFNIAIVKTKIKNYLELKYYQDLLKENNYRDTLTQISNRRHFDEVFETEKGKARRYGQSMAVVLIDIDYFKRYNDTYGHLEGDECLKQVAQTLKKGLKRPGDFIARWGGEEFICLLPDTDLSGAAEVAERLREAVFQCGIPHQASLVSERVTVSIGIVSSSPVDLRDDENLVNFADLALYKAKENGRNRIFSWEN